MKVSSIIFTALVVAASVDAVVTPQTPPDAEAINEFCSSPGQPCSNLKRAADAAAEALAEPLPDPEAANHIWCWRPGQPCSKAKRDALALAEAVAEAHASANPDPEAGN